MNVANLLTRLEAEGVNVSLNLKLKADIKPSDETLNLIRENRILLLTHLSKARALQSLALTDLLEWIRADYGLCIKHPGGFDPISSSIYNARPEQIMGAVALYPWGIVHDTESYLLMSWGDVPSVQFAGLRDLETGGLVLQPEAAFDELPSSSNKSPSGAQKSDLMNDSRTQIEMTAPEAVA